MKILNRINSVLFLLCMTLSFAQQTPASEQTKDFAIVGATAHIGNGDVIENSIIVVRNGKITTIASFVIFYDINNDMFHDIYLFNLPLF